MFKKKFLLVSLLLVPHILFAQEQGAPAPTPQAQEAQVAAPQTNQPAVIPAAQPTPQVAPVAAPESDRPSRSGFTINLSLGFGQAYYIPKAGSSKNHWGMGGLNLALGGFVNRDFAILFQINGINWGPFDSDKYDRGISATFGPAVQWWPHDRLWLLASPGFGMSIVDPKGWEASKKSGFGMTIGVGYSILAVKHHALGLCAYFSPIFASELKTITSQIGVMWQFH